MLSASLPGKEIFISVLKTGLRADQVTCPRQLETSGLFGTWTEGFQHPFSLLNYHNPANCHLHSAYYSVVQDVCSKNNLYKEKKQGNSLIANEPHVNWHTEREVAAEQPQRLFLQANERHLKIVIK